MKKLLFFALFFPSLSFGSGIYNPGSGSGGASSTDIYPATNTASFPYGLTASTITTSGPVLLGGSSGSNLFGYPIRIIGSPTNVLSLGYGDSGFSLNSAAISWTNNNVDVLDMLNGTSLTSNVPWVFGGYNCSGNTNSGKLTVDGSGNVACADDISGGGDGNNFNNYTATNTLSMGSKAISNIGTTNSFFDSGGGLTVNSSVTIAAGISIKGASKTADYTATINDAIILSSSTAGTTRYITLPGLILTSSQTVASIKNDLSGNPVVVRTNSATDLINGTTTQLWMYAPGQNVGLYADKNSGSWWTTGRAPTTPPIIGIVGNDPNSAVAVVATTTYCHAEYVPDFAVMYGMGFNVGAQSTSSNFQISAYDNYGVLIGTSVYTPLPGNGIQVRNFMNPVYLAPGTVWLCFGSNAAILTISRRSTGGNDMGTCSFATSVPFAAKQTFAGCNHTGNDYAFFGLVNGGIIP